jgi:hypothetical protein
VASTATTPTAAWQEWEQNLIKEATLASKSFCNGGAEAFPRCRRVATTNALQPAEGSNMLHVEAAQFVAAKISKMENEGSVK